METRAGEKTSLQVSRFGAITGLSSANFSRSTGNKTFLIKNDGTENVTLEVKPALGDSFVETVFMPGWNPELVREIKLTATSVNLKWGE